MVFDRIIGGHGEDRLAYDLTRAHSADVFFLKMRAWFWGSCAGLAGFLVGNILGVFDINIMGFLFDTLLNGWGH